MVRCGHERLIKFTDPEPYKFTAIYRCEKCGTDFYVKKTEKYLGDRWQKQ